VIQVLVCLLLDDFLPRRISAVIVEHPLH
jgi:hypothetical protein